MVWTGVNREGPLRAVLDTNYYRATHVTSINMGYAAGMFASFLGTAWLVLNAIGFRRGDEAFHKSIVRATYGVTAFGLVFAVFGPIYGPAPIHIRRCRRSYRVMYLISAHQATTKLKAD